MVIFRIGSRENPATFEDISAFAGALQQARQTGGDLVWNHDVDVINIPDAEGVPVPLQVPVPPPVTQQQQNDLTIITGSGPFHLQGDGSVTFLNVPSNTIAMNSTMEPEPPPIIDPWEMI